MPRTALALAGYGALQKVRQSTYLDVLDDRVLLVFPGHGELREPDLPPTVPLAVVPQYLNHQYKTRGPWCRQLSPRWI